MPGQGWRAPAQGEATWWAEKLMLPLWCCWRYWWLTAGKESLRMSKSKVFVEGLWSMSILERNDGGMELTTPVPGAHWPTALRSRARSRPGRMAHAYSTEPMAA